MLNKTIWTFWDKGEENAPEYIQKCFNTWRKINPGWRVQVLSFNTMGRFIDMNDILGSNYQNIPIQALTDIIRVNLLAEYGGVWVDATCVCKKPLDAWLPAMMKSGFFAFHKPGPDREISSWFLAAHENCCLPKKWAQHINPLWKNAEIDVVSGGVDKLYPDLDLNSPPWLLDVFWDKPCELPYFWVHFSFAYLLAQNQKFKTIWAKTPKFTADIPHFFMPGLYAAREIQTMELEWKHGIAPLYKTSHKDIRVEEGLNNPMLFILSKI